MVFSGLKLDRNSQEMSCETVDQNSFCRFCLGKLKNPIQNKQSSKILADLNSIFNLEIYEEDAWPKQICACCRDKSEKCVIFIEKIKNAEKQLKELFGEKFPILKKEIIFPEELPVDVKEESDEEDVKSSEGEEVDLLDDDGASSKNSSWAPSSSAEESEDEEPVEPEVKKVKKAQAPETLPKKKCGRKRKPPKEITRKKSLIKTGSEVVKKYLGFKCDLCGHEATNYFTLKSHFRIVHGIKGYMICCETKFICLGDLAGHLQKHFDPETFKCTKCSKILGNQKSLLMHLRDCLKDPENYTFICDVCSRAFPSSRALYCHRRKMHTTEAEKIHKCSDCPKSYLTPSELKFHWTNTHDTKKQSVCDVCGKAFRTKWQAKHHMKVTHLKKDVPKVKCDRCGGYYSNESTLKQHQKRCQMEAVKCNDCSKMYCNEMSLKRHMKYAHGENGKKTYPCDKCPKFFSTKRLLVDHTAKHSNIPRHKCTYCDQQFYTLSAKYAHQRVHHPAENAAAKLRKQ